VARAYNAPKRALTNQLTKKILKTAQTQPGNMSPDLTEKVAIWPELPEHIRAAIKTLVQTGTQKNHNELRDFSSAPFSRVFFLTFPATRVVLGLLRGVVRKQRLAVLPGFPPENVQFPPPVVSYKVCGKADVYFTSPRTGRRQSQEGII
jgi:hypothetical protein